MVDQNEGWGSDFDKDPTIIEMSDGKIFSISKNSFKNNKGSGTYTRVQKMYRHKVSGELLPSKGKDGSKDGVSFPGGLPKGEYDELFNAIWGKIDMADGKDEH